MAPVRVIILMHAVITLSSRTKRRFLRADALAAVLEAHDRPDPALCYARNYRPVPGARGRAPSRSGVPRPLMLTRIRPLPD
jgi:hypothetical protein